MIINLHFHLTADGSKVELVSPHPESNIGDRIFVAAHPVTNAQRGLVPNTVKKLKVWETVSADLRTNADLQVCWKGLPFLTTAGNCVVDSLGDAVVS